MAPRLQERHASAWQGSSFWASSGGNSSKKVKGKTRERGRGRGGEPALWTRKSGIRELSSRSGSTKACVANVSSTRLSRSSLRIAETNDSLAEAAAVPGWACGLEGSSLTTGPVRRNNSWTVPITRRLMPAILSAVRLRHRSFVSAPHGGTRLQAVEFTRRSAGGRCSRPARRRSRRGGWTWSAGSTPRRSSPRPTTMR